MAVPGAWDPERGCGRGRVLGERKQDQVVDEESTEGRALDRPGHLALRVGQAEALFAAVKGDLQGPVAGVGLPEEDRVLRRISAEEGFVLAPARS